MGERAVSVPVASISPVQQMLASGTGALLTSVFGEITDTKPQSTSSTACYSKHLSLSHYIRITLFSTN